MGKLVVAIVKTSAQLESFAMNARCQYIGSAGIACAFNEDLLYGSCITHL